jgi:hypothetical protein
MALGSLTRSGTIRCGLCDTPRVCAAYLECPEAHQCPQPAHSRAHKYAIGQADGDVMGCIRTVHGPTDAYPCGRVFACSIAI